MLFFNSASCHCSSAIQQIMAEWSAAAADPDRKADAHETNICLQGLEQVGAPTGAPSAAEHIRQLGPKTKMDQGSGDTLPSLLFDLGPFSLMKRYPASLALRSMVTFFSNLGCRMQFPISLPPMRSIMYASLINPWLLCVPQSNFKAIP